MTIIDVIVSRR